MARCPHTLPSPDETAAMLRALGDPRRYDIVRQLAAAPGPVACADLAQAGQVGASTMTHHLQLLEQAGLIQMSREGRCAVLRFERERYEAFLRRLADDAATARRPDPAP